MKGKDLRGFWKIPRLPLPVKRKKKREKPKSARVTAALDAAALSHMKNL